MTFLWRDALWLLLCLPALVGAYLLLLRRRNKQALRYASLSVVREAIGPTQWNRRHIPALLLLLAFIAMLLAVARPVIVTTLPSEQGTIILAIDVSLSMAATDVPPTRLAAAQAAAKALVKAQPRDVLVGILSFAADVDVAQLPTANREEALAAIDQLQLREYTAIGNAVIGALLTIFPNAEIGQYDIFGLGRRPGGPQTTSLHEAIASERGQHKPVAPGSYLSAAIILVSDGIGTMGVPPVTAAKMAADHGVRVFTVGVGTPYGGIGYVKGRAPVFAEFSEEILREIADITRGEYFYASTTDKMKKIYLKLGKDAIFERKESEITALLTAIGAISLLASAMLSLVWFYPLLR